jgi:hypothetical protein
LLLCLDPRPARAGCAVCHAFPDDEYVTDQLLVGLISVAVALPVDFFLARAFEIANEGSAPESWLEAPTGVLHLLLGKAAHNDWRLADAKRPMRDLVLWCVRYGSSESLLGSATRLLGWLARKARERLRGAPSQQEAAEPESPRGGASPGTSSGAASSSHASEEARADAITKRLYAAAGLLGVYVTWTIMAWFIFTYGAWQATHSVLRHFGLTLLSHLRHADLQDTG